MKFKAREKSGNFEISVRTGVSIAQRLLRDGIYEHKYYVHVFGICIWRTVSNCLSRD